jgi:hypothetical protein
MSDPSPRRRTEPVVAIFVAVLWGAVLFALDGVLAVMLDRDPIPAHESPYYGVVTIALTGIVVWAGVSVGAGARRPWLAAVTVAAVVYLVAVGTAIPLGLRLVVAQASSPFVAGGALLAAVAVVATWAVLRRAARG